MLLRGLYDEGWNPAPASAGRHERPELLESIRHELRDHLELRDPARVARTVFGVIALHVTPGEVQKIVPSLPREVRALWPAPSQDQQQAAPKRRPKPKEAHR
jgi:uncharacterized protein (DUF2267 family)